MEAVQTKTGQNEYQQGKKRQMRAKKAKESETTQVKTEKWGNSGWYYVITVVSHLKLFFRFNRNSKPSCFAISRNSQNQSSLFWIVLKLISVLSIRIEFCRTPYISDLCHHSCSTYKVVSFASTETPKLAVSLYRETTKTILFVSDSVETSFGSGFGCLDMNRVS